jgi:Ca2+:H+ antiporter
MLLSVAAMAIPSLAHGLHTPALAHEKTFSVIAAVILLTLFVLSLPASLRRGSNDAASEAEPPRWPVWLAITLLAAASALAAFVSDWFVDALEPAMGTLGVSDVFAGLVVVAIAGNAIENIVGVQLAARGQSEYAFAIILNSPIQISLVLAPLLVLVSVVFGLTTLTLVFSPLLVACLLLSVILATVITIDGESNWLEGASLIALYAVVATSFWWG